MENPNKGMLYIVSTPIGNLSDITLRAIEVLKGADLIIAEDTRRTSILLQKYNLKNKKMISYNDFNKIPRTQRILKDLNNGDLAAIVSDAGTPGISDPGFYLIRACIRNGIAVIPIPGASALLAALVASGLPTDSFIFIGYLSKKKGKKRKTLVDIRLDPAQTYIFYESPHRMKRTLALMAELIPDKLLVIAREVTKKFEEFIRGTVQEIYEKEKNRDWKGEIVILVYG